MSAGIRTDVLSTGEWARRMQLPLYVRQGNATHVDTTAASLLVLVLEPLAYDDRRMLIDWHGFIQDALYLLGNPAVLARSWGSHEAANFRQIVDRPRVVYNNLSLAAWYDRELRRTRDAQSVQTTDMRLNLLCASTARGLLPRMYEGDLIDLRRSADMILDDLRRQYSGARSWIGQRLAADQRIYAEQAGSRSVSRGRTRNRPGSQVRFDETDGAGQAQQPSHSRNRRSASHHSRASAGGNGGGGGNGQAAPEIQPPGGEQAPPQVFVEPPRHPETALVSRLRRCRGRPIQPFAVAALQDALVAAARRHYGPHGEHLTSARREKRDLNQVIAGLMSMFCLAR